MSRAARNQSFSPPGIRCIVLRSVKWKRGGGWYGCLARCQLPHEPQGMAVDTGWVVQITGGGSKRTIPMLSHASPSPNRPAHVPILARRGRLCHRASFPGPPHTNGAVCLVCLCWPPGGSLWGVRFQLKCAVGGRDVRAANYLATLGRGASATSPHLCPVTGLLQ